MPRRSIPAECPGCGADMGERDALRPGERGLWWWCGYCGAFRGEAIRDGALVTKETEWVRKFGPRTKAK